jgi:acyl transferase domain-containing protein/NAD(P)H-dependent flavin oxidoreductase YrpB (nitropropane dioxygenase family)/NAD(P)-dependent dehydrogenase (short-subunit alcohol dehydrogenase family)
MLDSLQIATLTPGLLEPSLALATNRSGELAILDFEYVIDPVATLDAIQRFHDVVRAPFGIKLRGDMPELLARILADLPHHVKTIVLTSAASQELPEYIRVLREKQVTTLFEATCLDQAKQGEAIGVDGLVAKGHEAGGIVGDETTFILLQRFIAEVRLPVWAHGGIGLHTAGACAAAGAAGLVLDVQLALTRESSLPESVRARIASMDGSETVCLGDPLGETYRMYFRPGNPAVRELQEIESRLAHDGRAPMEIRLEWRQAVLRRAGWQSDQNALLLGQDGAFAAPLAERFRTVGGVLHGMREAIRAHCLAAVRLRPLAEGASLACSNGTRYPILQGPMTRVSDVPEFAFRVAEGGALPFLALALMRGAEIKRLLAETQSRLGARPWGVGILGFVPPALREEQINAIGEYRPPFALIAGGRPDQARALEQKGICTYLHVPSPGLLRMFVQQGARHFVFEGRECGGHVGPRTSFVLWNQMVDALLDAPELAAGPEEFHVVFAAGIHDALSATMVSVIGAPLAERRVRIGVLLGTAYLFTEEAVTSGAILDTFQEQALQCHNTVLLETGPGHATRCADTPYSSTFAEEKRRLIVGQRPAEEIRVTLEELNLGRLRIASKGVARHPQYRQDPAAAKLVRIDQNEQVAQGMYMIGQVAALRQKTCTVQELHREVAVESSNRLQSLAGRSWQASSITPVESPSDVAIIGMACHLPKASRLEAFWENLLSKVDAIGEIPKDRWDWQLYFDSNPKAKDKIYSRWGGFLEEIPFDPVQYGMPPASLRSIEPAQLLALEVVRAALADAGYLNRPFARERTSVILGAGGGAADLGLGYSARSFIPILENLPEFRGRSKDIIDSLDGLLPEWTEDSFAGILTNVSAGRVANRFDLGGSNYTVDAACASSLAAVSLALKELEARTSDMVIVGGVDTMQNPFTYLCFSKTHALSPRGRCRTFDESADGIAISEGIAMMVLKRLADAERDGDRIYAVVKASGSSSDGRDRGLTAPRPEGQARALKRAYAKAGFSPATVGLIEAHGTGTVAGDGAEVQALTDVFSEAHAPLQSCAIGSVKSMIGHTKCTAGAAGLIKTALALHRKVLPPTLGVEKPNPRAGFGKTPFFVNTEARPWLESLDGRPRRAGVSAFGFGGTNFHIVLEEYSGDPSSSPQAACRIWSDELFVWKSDSRQTLLQTLEAWERALAANVKPALRDLAYTAWKQVSENPAGHDGPLTQLTVVASSLDDLKQKLGWARHSLARPETVRINDPRGIYFTEQPLASLGKLAFLFPGQGSQYPRMFQDLLLHFPEMRHSFELAARVLARKLDRPLGSYVFPPPSFSREEEQVQQQALTRTDIAQPALGAVSLAMADLLRELGLKPEMMAGHSYGEYVALAAAGVFSVETLIALSESRGRFITEAAGSEPGIMAAIEAEAGMVTEVIKNYEGVCLANANAPKQSIISGSRSAVQRVVEHFAGRGTTARVIPVACAFHSALVAPAQPRLCQFLSTVEVAEPRIPVYSNTTAAPYPNDPQAIRGLLVEHLVRPVEFVREIQALYDAGARVFVEVGPRGILTNLVEEILIDRPKLAVASNQSGRPGLTQLLHLIGQLAVQGFALDLDRLYRDRTNRRLDLRALRDECSEEPLAPSVWMVNGARARPLKEVPSQHFRPEATNVQAPPAQNQPAEGAAEPVYTPLATSSATTPAPAEAPANRASTGATPLSPVSSPANGPDPSVAESPVARDGVPDVMTQFQATMARFLETQKTVMLAYLSAEPSAIAPALSVSAPISEPLQNTARAGDQLTKTAALGAVPPPPAERVAATAAAPAKQDPPLPPSGPNRQKLTTQLLSIVSERTGYPPEMLDLKLDLEADLGIDSIKRVEILGTLQQSFAAAGMKVDESLMETLSGVRTLQGIIDGVLESAEGQATGAVQTAEQPHPQPTAGLKKEELTRQLLSVVSERTGYPTEMLNLNLDLEADLGIDSIKRVEILGTFQQSFAAAGLGFDEGLMEKLTGIRTLQGILELVFEAVELQPQAEHAGGVLESTAGDRAQPTPLVSDHSELDEEDKIRRFTLMAVETPLLGPPRNIAKDRAILIIGGRHVVAQELAGKLRRDGYRVVRVHQGQGVRQLDRNEYAADFGSPESVAEVMALVSRRQGPLSGIVHLLALDAKSSFLAHDYAAWREQLRIVVKSLFYVAKASSKYLRESAAESDTVLIAATGMGGAFLSQPPADAVATLPDHAGVAGLTKTLALEWPEVRVKVVDLNLDESGEVLAGHLLEELYISDEAVEVGYAGSRRITLKLTHAPLSSEPAAALDLDPASVVLLTGGARGITAIAAKRLAELYQPTLILVGRSPLPPPHEASETAEITDTKELKIALMDRLRIRGERITPAVVERAYERLIREREVRSNLAALRQLGSQVHYFSIDARDPETFGAFLDNIYTSFGRLDGVIHGAGIIEDKLIEDKMPESFDRVFDTKVDSAFILSRKLRSEGLKFLLFFASVSGRFGNRGQADYASANEVLSKLAVCLDRTWPGRIVAINWGPWDTEGMVSAEVRKQFAKRGVKLISPSVGLRRLEEEMNSGRRGEAEIVIGGGEWPSPRQSATSQEFWPLLRHAVLSGRKDSVELVRELDPAHDLYFNDHRLDGQAVLPLAVATELIAETVAQGWPKMQVAGIRDLRLLHGIVLDRGTKKIRVLAKPQIGAAVNPERVAVEITGTEQPQRIHYGATVELAQQLPDAPTLKLAPLADGRGFSMEIADLYRQWLFHGPLFQGISRVDLIGVSGVKAVLATSSPRGWISGAFSGQWVIDPLMFDSALQLVVLWAREHWDVTALPSGFQIYRRFAAPPQPHVVCEMRFRPSTGRQTIHADIFFLEAASGRTLAIVEDMHGACSKALNRLSGAKVLAAAGNPS